MNTLFLIDDHPMLRRGLASYLSETGKYRVVGEASTLEEAFRALERIKSAPKLIILDIELGKESGFKLFDYLNRKKAQPKVLVFSIFNDPFRIQSAIHLGAQGYVSKAALEDELVRAIDTVLNGEIYLDPSLEKLIDKKNDVYTLFTRRERDILTLIKRHYGNQQIAKELSLSLRTVENYLTRIYDKTGVKYRNDLLAL
ncbi:MAG: response regulator transcription factor [Treponema sp.]|jgi:NarL family two-component system response regulator LiaR|nr:response regulator transcription factor [Treponema sp.]